MSHAHNLVSCSQFSIVSCLVSRCQLARQYCEHETLNYDFPDFGALMAHYFRRSDFFLSIPGLCLTWFLRTSSVQFWTGSKSASQKRSTLCPHSPISPLPRSAPHPTQRFANFAHMTSLDCSVKNAHNTRSTLTSFDHDDFQQPFPRTTCCPNVLSL